MKVLARGGIDAPVEEAEAKDLDDGLKKMTIGVLGPTAPPALTQWQVIGTMFVFLSNDSDGPFP
jgi:hypothetical protein